MNWLGHEGLWLMQTFNDTEQEEYRTGARLFEVFSDKFKLQHNETILLLKCCKLVKEENENAEEWIGHIRHEVNECGCKEKYRRLKEQFIIGVKMRK